MPGTMTFVVVKFCLPEGRVFVVEMPLIEVVLQHLAFHLPDQ
jgi:hypothetical protein